MDKPSAILPGALDQLKSDLTKPKASKNEMGQEQFFDLMVTQLQNQDPFNPMERHLRCSPIRRCRPRLWSGGMSSYRVTP